MSEINVVYSGNRAMSEGIMLSIMSLCKYNSNVKINVYILTYDFSYYKANYYPITYEEVELFKDAGKIFNKNINVILIDNHPVIIKNKDLLIKLDNNYTLYTLLRLFIPEIKSIPDRVLYLDCDTMICGSLNELFTMDLENYLIFGVRDYLGKFWMKRRSVNYFNAGVLLFNKKRLIEENFTEKCLKLLNTKKYTFGDQTVLNILCKENKGYFKFLPHKYNEQRNIKKDTVIKHFCKGIKRTPFFHIYNIKQWEIEKVQRVLKITKFDDIYKEYEKFSNRIREDRYILTVSHLFKSYNNEVKAVNDVSFKVRKGSLFAFLGVNGAGKSTTINIIASILQKDAGSVFVNRYDIDKDADKIKKEIGIVFQNSVLDQDLSVKQNLDIRTSFYSMSRQEKKQKLDMIIKLLNLEDILHRPIKNLSGGQKRRVDIARAMVHQPKLLILDEPTTGLDPKTRLIVWDLIDHIRKETNMTVFLTTHYLEEADQATFVTIMDGGKIIAEGSPNELKNKYSSDVIIVYLERNVEFEEFLKINKEKYVYDKDHKAYRIFVETPLDAKEKLHTYSYYINDYEVIKGSMDDVFLNVTGKEFVLGEENDRSSKA